MTADVFERGNGIPAGLQWLGARVTVEPLTAGDYRVGVLARASKSQPIGFRGWRHAMSDPTAADDEVTVMIGRTPRERWSRVISAMAVGSAIEATPAGASADAREGGVYPAAPRAWRFRLSAPPASTERNA